MTHTILEIVLYSLVCLGIYHLLLAKTALHRIKRFYLLFALLLSVAIPFIDIDRPSSSNELFVATETITQPIAFSLDNFSNKRKPSEARPNLGEATIAQESSRLAETTPKKQISSYSVLSYAYTLVVLVLFIRLIRHISLLFRRVKNSEHLDYKGARIVLLKEATSPFSFLNYIFIHQSDFSQKETFDELLTHELAHIKQRHTLDILLVELFKTVLWFNPFFHFYGKAIRQNHEYLADAEVIKKHQNISNYQKLLFQFIKRGQSIPHTLASPFNYSFTQKRFIMMSKKNSKSSTIIRSSLTLLLLSLITMSFTFRPVEEITSPDLLLSDIQGSTFDELPNKPQIAPVDLANEHIEMVLHFGATMKYGTPEMYDHEGIDFRAKLGTPVRATADGIVETSTKNDSAYGHFIKIKHSDEYQTLYASLNELKASPGESIKKGQIIGTVGNSIPDSNIHLHYEVIKNGKKVDPDEYFFYKHNTSLVLFRSRMIASPGNLNYLTKHGINARGRRIRFSNKSKYGVIIYDKEQALFFSHDDKLIKQLKMSELSAEKIQALKDLKNGIYTYSRDRPKQELVDNWTNPQEYMVVIDGELIENSMMTQYKADDFSFQLLIKLRRSDPEKAKYRVDLFTNNFFDKLVSAQEKLGLELVSTNNELMNIIDK